MKRCVGWGIVAGAVLILSALGVTSAGPATGSSLSRSSAGWSAARRYVEEQGSIVTTLDEPLGDSLDGSEVLVISGGNARDFSKSEIESFHRFLMKGGHAIFGYEAGMRSRALSQLAMDFKRSAGMSTTINPFKWKAETAVSRKYSTGLGSDGIALFPVREHPVDTTGDEVLVKNDLNEPLVILRKVGKGEILMAPAEVFSNGRLKEPGNASLFESVRARFDNEDGESEWLFDEYHHGITRASTPVGLKSRRALDLFLFQIVLAYALFAAALGRRFGPEWSDPPAASGATSTFLNTVATLHERLGHHRDASRALRERAREVLGLDLPTPLSTAARSAERELIETARAIQQQQKEGRTS